MGVNLKGFLTDNQEDQNSTEIIARYISDGFAPFKTGAISIGMDYDIDYLIDRFYVDVETFPNYEFRAQTFRDYRDDMVSYSHAIGQTLYSVIRYRKIVPREPNIILGEE